MRRMLCCLTGVLLSVFLTIPGASALAATPRNSPTFTYPTPNQVLPYGRALTVAVQRMAHAHGYLWSFLQHGAIVYQDLDATGRLDGPTITLLPMSAAYTRLTPGAVVVRVRALLAGGQWTPVGTLALMLAFPAQAHPARLAPQQRAPLSMPMEAAKSRQRYGPDSEVRPRRR
jgi:hypothetical protein